MRVDDAAIPVSRRIRLMLEYLGTRYVGWQWQDNGLSIQEVVETALDKLMEKHGRVNASGRTDAGVHALAQPAHADVQTRMTDEELLNGLNALLPPDIVVREVSTVSPDWNARFSATKKTYRYTILNRHIPSVLHHGRAWHIKKPLDIGAMKTAGRFLPGKHDFASFQSSGSDTPGSVRELYQADIFRDGDLIHMEFTANGFLKQMVRNMVGTLVETGRGKMAPEKMTEILTARDRQQAGPCAPAHGLFMVGVIYGEGTPKDDQLASGTPNE